MRRVFWLFSGILFVMAAKFSSAQELKAVPAFTPEHCSKPAIYVLDHGFIGARDETPGARLHVVNGSPNAVFVQDEALDISVTDVLSPDGTPIRKSSLPRTISSRDVQERTIHLRPTSVGKWGAPIISIGVVEMPGVARQQLEDVQRGKIQLRALVTVRWFNVESKQWREGDVQVALKAKAEK